jgi:hypothetical protein
MVNGRVYHQNMELLFADFVIRTSGWVGLDQTLNIMAEMPVPPKWLINNPLAEGLKKQTIRLPVAGTLSKPELDKRAMEQYTRQFVQRAAENLIENAVEQNLDRLFGK